MSRPIPFGTILLALALGCGGEPAPDLTRNLAVHEGNDQNGTVGQPVPTAPAIKVTDGSGAGVAGVAVTFSVASGGGTVTGGSQTTDAGGVARVGGWTLGQVPGANALTAQLTGASGSVTFNATAAAGAPTAVARAAGDNQTANTRTAVPVRPAVRVTDTFGNPVPGVNVTFAVAAGGGTLTGAAQTTDATGIATVGGWVLGASPGPNQIVATAAGTGIANNPITFGATGQEVVIQVGQDTTFQGGTVRVNRLIIPAGRTVTVANHLVLEADSTVTIAGTLRGNCAAIVINGAQAVQVSGTIDNACAAPPADPPGLTLVAKGGYDLTTATLRSTGDIDVTNDPTLTDADFLPGPAPASSRAALAGVICGVNSLTAPAAANGTDGTTGTPGKDGRTWYLRCRGDLSIGGTVAGQDGGHGGHGTDSQAGAANATGGRGGDGGRLVVKATGIVALGPGSTLRSGRGGNGGDATATAQESDAGATAPSATALGGRGGSPGLIEVRGKAGIQVDGTARFELGVGGDGGDATATGADGKDATAGKAAQHGGNATATGGAGGTVGSDRLSSSGNVLGGPPVIGGDGGAGGRATATAGTGGDSQLEALPNGGDGGRFAGTGGAGGDALARNLQNALFGEGGAGGAVALARGNGGTGWDDCGDPKKQGGKGGAGGSAAGGDGQGGTGLTNGAHGGITITDAGNGGQGGDGDPVGQGGAAGAETALTARQGPPAKVGRTFQPGAPGAPCGLPAGKGALRFQAEGLPASVPTLLGVIKSGTTTVAQVTAATQQIVLDPGNYVFEAVEIDPTGYRYVADACVVVAATSAGTAARTTRFDDDPCPFTIVANQITEMTRAWIVLNALITTTVTGLPLGTSLQLSYLQCLTANPCSGPTILGAVGALYLAAGLYQLLGPDLLLTIGLEQQGFRPTVRPIPLTLVAGAALQVAMTYYLYQSSLFFQATRTIKSDTRGHHPFIQMWAAAILVLRKQFSPPLAAPGAAGASQAGEIDITITGPAPWVTVTGTLATDGTIVATGAGTVAGFPNVPVKFTGKLNPDGSITGDYQMGQDTPPTGLPNGSITYTITGPQVAPPAASPPRP